MTTPIARIDGLSKSFMVRKSLLSRERIQALDDVSLPLLRGRILALVGESGSGKSTLARLLMKLDTPSGGAIRMDRDGQEVDIATITPVDYYRRVQMVFQDPYASINPRKRVWQIITAALANLGHYDRDTLRKIALRQMEQVGLGAQYLDVFPNALSGGQRQRVCIARALAAEPEILVLDEPLSALDVSIQAQILNLLLELQQRLGLTYLFISHDLAVVRHIADEVAVLYAGRLVEYGSVASVIDTPGHPYTQALVASALGSRQCGQRQVIKGELTMGGGSGLGCGFLPRCPQAAEQCRQQRPAMQRAPQRHVACFQVQLSQEHERIEA
ncbi:oligopeptide/dipeptide ABC transporter ATP-binding protein [Chitinimonas lacunae]|uniref:Oligopeptide/dipeptide ABC transporter ATP-binding protein n=1 Tax=Chitinimonas lacunae TaxID=1963018 RepID=A0ABV8MTM2_9NEIS